MSIHYIRNLSRAAALASALVATPALAVDLEFYFPVAVGGTAADTIKSLTSEYSKNHPDVNIKAIYAGSYSDASAKAITAARGGNAPQISVLLSTDMYTLIDEGLIVPFDSYVTQAEKKNWIGGFYPSFMLNSQADGKTWGIPFQRSTPVMYWNKDAFKAAGLDPEHAPAKWDELVKMGKALTKKDANGNVTQWGVRIPSAGFPYWLFQGLAIPNGATLADDNGKKTHFDTAAVVDAAQFQYDLAHKYGVMAPGSIGWGATPKAFLDGRTAIMWTTTGNLVNVTKNAPFDFGVAMLPAKKTRGAPTGGGNFYLFKDSTDAQKRASVDFVKWITAPKQSAQWTIATGYVAPRPETWDLPAMKAYVAKVPGALVARDQLKFAKAELSTYQNSRVTKIFNDALASVLAGDAKAASAMKDAQAKADAVLKPYR